MSKTTVTEDIDVDLRGQKGELGMAGAWIVRIIVIALLIMIAQEKVGWSISWQSVFAAGGAAALVYSLVQRVAPPLMKAIGLRFRDRD